MISEAIHYSPGQHWKTTGSASKAINAQIHVRNKIGVRETTLVCFNAKMEEHGTTTIENG